ncbi:MAG: DNA-protecting protein DprA [Actinomycetota bacterium]|jgi:DNA processing protein
MGGMIDEREARLLLTHWCEAGDESVGRRVRERGPITVVDEILAGTSPLPATAGSGGRVQAGTSMSEAIARWVEPAHAAADRIGARYVVPGDSEWPTQLDDLGEKAPIGLWVAGAGDLRLLALRSIAVVGARSATAYGASIARELALHLAEESWLTVSGGAFGIDAAAHRGALAAGGATACVLAGGVDVPYPRSHADLLAGIRESGVLVSEAPLGGAAMRHRFLTRNRLIAALSRGTVLVEAAVRSGGRSTVREAREINRIVMAFPGPVTSPMSAGCHAVIRDEGVHLVTSPREVVALVEGRLAPRDQAHSAATDDLGWRERRVLDAVPARRAAPLASIASVAGLGLAEAMAALGMLDAVGLVARQGDGWARART